MDKQQIPVGYKLTEVGVIPEDWDVKSFEQICNVNQGLQIAIDRRKKHPTINSKIYITVQYINSDDEPEYIDDYSKSVCCIPSDVLMTRTGNTGMVVTGQTGVFHNNFFKIEFNREKLNSSFFVYYLRSHDCQKTILEKAGTSTIPDLNHGDFYSIKIAIPAFSEQTAIANALSDVDALIAALEKLIDKKTAIKTATMQQLLTGKKRLPSFDQLDVGYKQTELGEIPSDWEVKTIGDFAPLQRGFDLPNKDRVNGIFPVVYSNGIVNFHNQYQVKGPGVVTGRSGTIGKVHYVEEDYWPHNTALWVHKFNNADPKYVHYLYLKIGFDRFTSGSGVPTLNRNDAHSFKLVVPRSLEEQTAIANVLSDMDTELDALQQRLAKTQHIKQGMMQELLTGKIRLVTV